MRIDDCVHRALYLEAEADAVNIAAGHVRVVVLQNNSGAIHPVWMIFVRVWTYLARESVSSNIRVHNVYETSARQNTNRGEADYVALRDVDPG